MAKLKALPKALIVGAVIAGIGVVGYKFMPAPKPKVQEQEVTTEVVSPPAQEIVVETARQAPPPVVVAEPEPAPQNNVSDGSAGLDSVLKAGKK